MITAQLLTECLSLAATAVAPDPHAAHVAVDAGTSLMGGGAREITLPRFYALIPFLPILGVLLTTLCAIFKIKSKLPAWCTVACLAAAFALTLSLFRALGTEGNFATIHAFNWINFAWSDSGSLTANFAFYIDSLTVLWMLFVTGLATLIALYASEYMAHDVGKGYSRFFMAFNLFVFSMACLVMGDNLLLLFLGWEGVGLCSYLLIGYFYKKPSAVAAAKKAFIVNRIGDLGLTLGIFLTFLHFGSVEYTHILSNSSLTNYMALAQAGNFADIPWTVTAIPLLLMIGAFGKSAQLPLYVWLPDAMEGPTPVSALIHAATMVTAGVYLIARTLPLFFLSDIALPIVAWVGTLTALVAATIGMAQFDIKRIMAYSTVSQLGYMFAGLAFLTAAGGAFHVFTHAFFKATLFLCCGAVMHGFSGQLDLRKLSGVWRIPGWRIVTIAMLVGCLNLAGFPFTAGFFSKDMILAEAFANTHAGYSFLGWMLLLTAGLTAYYTFRVYFRVFTGPRYAELGDESHDDHAHEHADTAHEAELDTHHHAANPHEETGHAPGWAINTVLATLAIASIVAAGAYFIDKDHHGWVGNLVHHSTANVAAYEAAGAHDTHSHAAHGTIFGQDPHKVMYYVSAIVGALGILIAFVLHRLARTTAATSKADSFLPALGPLPRWAQGKWYVDEFYNGIIVTPLRVLASVFFLFDKFVIDGLIVNLIFGKTPRAFSSIARRAQTGVLHDYALRMVAGIGLILLIVLLSSVINDARAPAADPPHTDTHAAPNARAAALLPLGGETK